MKQPMINYTQRAKFDHFDTPEKAVKPLLPYIPTSWTIWEPTDTYNRSNITKILRENGNEVIATNFDFLTTEPDFSYDCIITNPPYSIKDKFIKRCYDLDTRWALLLPITALEGVARGDMFRRNGVSVMVLDKRISYTLEDNGNWFNSSWFLHYIETPKNLLFTPVGIDYSCVTCSHSAYTNVNGYKRPWCEINGAIENPNGSCKKYIAG